MAVPSRKGLIIRYHPPGKEVLLGEIAPLPGWSNESLVEALGAVQEILAQFRQTDDLAKLELSKSWPESVRFCFSCFQEITPFDTDRSIPIQAWVGSLNEELLPLLLAKIEAGFTSIKVKVGFGSPKDEGKLLRGLIAKLPERAKLRLDVNRRWGLTEAQTFLEALADLTRIDYLEEPLARRADNEILYRIFNCRYAWDETLRELVVPPEKPPEGLAAVVIKPTLMGTLQEVRQWLRWAVSRGLKTVISSTIESSIGIAWLARLASEANTDAGLDTLSLLEEDTLIPPLGIEKGRLILPAHIFQRADLNTGVITELNVSP